MRKLDPIKILTEGSMRQRIKILYSDIAYLNVGKKDKVVFTQEQREQIFREDKSPKDFKYYNDLRKSNLSFLLYQPKLIGEVINLELLLIKLEKNIGILSGLGTTENIINSLLDVYPDKKSRETALKKILVELNIKAVKQQKKNKPAYIKIQDKDLLFKIEVNAGEVLLQTMDLKLFIAILREFLNKYLPLSPYKDFLKDEENKIITLYDKAIKYCETYEHKYILTPYRDIEVKYPQSNIEMIKRAGSNE